MLIDKEAQVAYIPVSLELLRELRDWNEPVRVRFENGELVFKKLGQPVKGVYIPEPELTNSAI